MGADTTDVSASPGAVPLACFLARRHERVLSHLQPHHAGVHYSHANNGRPRPENSLVGLRGARVLVFPMRRLLKLSLFSFDVNARARSPFGCRSLTPSPLSLSFSHSSISRERTLVSFHPFSVSRPLSRSSLAKKNRGS